MAKNDARLAKASKSFRDAGLDILDRDYRDTDRGSDYLPYYDSSGKYQELRARGKAPTELESMAFVDAARRQLRDGNNMMLPKELVEKGLRGERAGRKLKDTMSDLATSKAAGYKTKGYARGGSTASKRADGCAQRGKTKGRFV